MTTEETKTEETVYSFLGFLLLIPLILTKGSAFYLLYKWFVFPMTGYWLGFWQLVGLTILADITQMAFTSWKPDRPAKEMFQACVGRLSVYAGSILFGWLTKLMV